MNSAFDKIIGYKSIKDELLQISDMIHNREIYKKIGAKLPKGVLLYGNPGLGKSLMAECLIEDCGIATYTIRRNKGNDDFVSEISEKFAMAAKNTPSIVFLDDMDKYANEDDEHPDCAEYVAVQAGIDEVKNADVFVFATVNDMDKLPESLIRVGRFDRKICVKCPTDEDAAEIIKFYLSDKKLAPGVNLEDLTKMISYSSCAELETILNEGAVRAAFKRKDAIEMEDMTEAVLRMVYDSPNEFCVMDEEERKMIALHEAGHAVVSEVLLPGSVGLVSLRSTGRNSTGGFTHTCKEHRRRPHCILIALAGKAAVELYNCETNASGCQEDLRKATRLVEDGVAESGTCGMSFLVSFCKNSTLQDARMESAVRAELERYMLMTKNILLKNRSFLEQVAKALEDKETLLYSDIRRIREANEIVQVAV